MKFDIWYAAKLLIDQHGVGAADCANKRCEQLFDEGDAEGASFLDSSAGCLGLSCKRREWPMPFCARRFPKALAITFGKMGG